jgi:hypothetical protein
VTEPVSPKDACAVRTPPFGAAEGRSVFPSALPKLREGKRSSWSSQRGARNLLA